MISRFALAFAALTAAAAIADDRAPEAALSGLTVHADLQAELFAAEPLLLSPSNIDVDHLGRVWVCEVVNYRGRNGERPEGDRILILTDTDGDGVADEQTVFYQGREIDSALGICVLDNRVLVSCSPNVWLFTDDDRDGKADRKEKIFTNAGIPQHDHSAHAFVFGPDGRLYWNFGNTGHQVHDANGEIVKDIFSRPVRDDGKPYRQGMAFRMNEDFSNFEVLGHNFRNNFELAVDAFGTVWQSDNDDDGNRAVRINYVMEYGNYGYTDEVTGAGWRDPRSNMEAEIPLRHWHLNDPGVVPNLLQTMAGSPTGIVVYEGTLLPEVFRNQIIHCDAGPNVVRAYPVVNDRAGYRASVVNILEGSEDRWFRPSDVTVAPDGSLIVADWYDPGVGGHAMGDTDRGRIYRIVPKGHRGFAVPKLDLSSPQGAVAALLSPNQATRYVGYKAVQGFGSAAVEALAEVFEGVNPRHRARALWALSELPAAQQTLAAAMLDPDADIRITAIRIARRKALEGDAALLEKAIAANVKDSSPQVRRELALSLRQLSAAWMPKVWAQLAAQHDGSDRWYLEALGISAEGRWDACFDAWMEKVGRGWNRPNGHDIVFRARAKAALPLLASLIRDPSRSLSQSLRYFRAFDFHEASQMKLDTLAGLLDVEHPDRASIAALALAQMGDVDPESNAKLLARIDVTLDSARGTEGFLRAVERLERKDRSKQVLEMAINAEDDALGIDAVGVLVRFEQQGMLLAALGNLEDAQAMRLIHRLGYAGHNNAMQAVAAVSLDEQRPLPIRAAAVRALGVSISGLHWLRGLAERGNLAPDLHVTAAAVLSSAPDQRLRDAVKHLNLPASATSAPLPPIAELAARRGDASRGREAFTKAVCVTCHRVDGEGIDFGPDLSGIGAKLARSALYEAILSPSAAISFGFEGYIVTLEGGSQLVGYLSGQTTEAITLRQPGGVSSRIERSRVESMQKLDASLMTPNLQALLSEQELVDLVEWLTTLSGKAASVSGR